jgi:outer membrane murein-binding lipoprotein Lpp
MAKRCPSCGYSPIGPFTDNCPICAEPVRNVRSNAGGFPQFANMSPTLRWVIGGAVVAVLCVAGCCGIGMWRLGTAVKDAQTEFERFRAEAEANRQARTVVVAAAELLREFQTDPVAADQKYMGKYLEITGIVERSGRGRFDSSFAILSGGDENAKLKIECFFDLSDENDEARIRRLGKGQTITVRGEYDGQVSNVQLRECVLVK